jgi:hypothetical protein
MSRWALFAEVNPTAWRFSIAPPMTWLARMGVVRAVTSITRAATRHSR